MGGEAAAGAGLRRRATGGGGLRQLVVGAVLKPHAERRTLAPHDTLDGKGIKAGTFEG